MSDGVCIRVTFFAIRFSTMQIRASFRLFQFCVVVTALLCTVAVQFYGKNTTKGCQNFAQQSSFFVFMIPKSTMLLRHLFQLFTLVVTEQCRSTDLVTILEIAACKLWATSSVSYSCVAVDLFEWTMRNVQQTKNLPTNLATVVVGEDDSCFCDLHALMLAFLSPCAKGIYHLPVRGTICFRALSVRFLSLPLAF